MTSLFGFPDKPNQDTSGSTGGYADPKGIPAPEGMTNQERALRDLFVAEYLVDYNPLTAAIRCGFGPQMALEYSQKFLSEPYVQQRISQVGIGKNDDSKEINDYNKKRIIEGLTREAFHYGPGSSHAARVSALKALADLHHMMKIPDKPGEKGSVGGVMQVPALADLDEWEQAASESQDALVKHAGTGE